MEEKLTLEELNLIAKAIFEKDKNNRRFLAAIQGIDIGEDEEQELDIAELDGWQANQEGFGIGQGLGYETIDG